jgi:hypothetical protein
MKEEFVRTHRQRKTGYNRVLLATGRPKMVGLADRHSAPPFPPPRPVASGILDVTYVYTVH